MLKKKILPVIVLLLIFTNSFAYWDAVYQFGIEIPKPINDPIIVGKTIAFLWVPPNVKTLHAVVLAPANIIERRFCDDPIIREQAAKVGIALLFFQAGWSKDAADSPRLIVYMQDILDKLAKKSGYRELSIVPWIPVGHSGNSKFCQGIARQKPEHVLANIIFKGALPGPDKSGSAAGLKGIPILFFTGEFEEVMPPGRVRNAWWEVQLQRFANARELVPDALISGVEDRGRGHVSFTPDMAAYAALFIHKAVRRRLGRINNDKLLTISYNSGWLADPTDSSYHAKAKKYNGNKQKAFWFFDQEQYKAWKLLQFRDIGKKEQLLAFTQADTIAPWWKGWGVQEIEFKPLADGVTFVTHAKFREKVPQPFADAGMQVGHAKDESISYSVAGWASNTEQIGPDKFRVRFDREGVNGRTTHILISASHPGDKEYRETVAAVHFYIPSVNLAGIKQTLIFPQIANVKANVMNIPLNATCSSGLKPYYYVSWGPAEIVNGNSIRITSIPVNSKFPIEVMVTAYQYGSSIEPKYATSNAVTQTFMIEK